MWVKHIGQQFPNDRGGRANKYLEITHSNIFGHMRDVVFINNNVSIASDLEIRPNRRNEAQVMVGMDEPSKSPSFDFGEYN